MRISTVISACALAVVVLATTACGPKIDVKTDLAIVDITTGWFDAGIVKTANGDENRIVPTVAFKIKNVSDKTIGNVMVDVVFHVLSDKDKDWGNAWVKGVGGEGLKPGAISQEFVLRGENGYTSLQPRLQMLQNRTFADAIVDVLLKQGASNYVKMTTVKIDRQLLTQ